jgi:two-component sensor histidine kinase
MPSANRPAPRKAHAGPASPVTAAWLDRVESAVSQAAAASDLDDLVTTLSRDARDLADAASATVVAVAPGGLERAEASDGKLAVSIGRLPGEDFGAPGLAGSTPAASTPSAAPPAAGPHLVVQRLPLTDGGEVVGTLTVKYPNGRLGPNEERLALVRAFAAAAGPLIGRQRDRMGRKSGAADRDRPRPSDAGRAERVRLARELHDGLIQSLYGLGLLIRTQAERTDLPEKGRRRMQGWVRRIDGLVDETTAYVAELEVRGDALIDLGAGIDSIAEEAAAAGLDVSTEVSSFDNARLSSEVRRELLVVAREAASNAIRHAGAHRLALHVEIDSATETATLTVDDDGVGFEPALHRPGGHGLDNMAARAAAMKGSLDVLSRRSAGTRVRLRIPMQRPASGAILGSDD